MIFVLTGGEPITAGEYTPYGAVTEFKYCNSVASNRYQISVNNYNLMAIAIKQFFLTVLEQSRT